MSLLHTVPTITQRDQEVSLLVDADYLTYMLAAISQHQHKPPNTDGCEYVCIDEETDTWVWVEPRGLLDWKIRNEFDKLKDRFRTDDLRIWLTPSEGNFREDIAVSRPYKGTRKGVRPYYYQAIRDYIQDELGGLMADGCEADDMVCCDQREYMEKGKRSVIVGPDKDLLCMYGYNYNPRRDVLRWVTPIEGAWHFFHQMLTGDTVDNIPGCPGIGPKRADKLMGEEPVGKLSPRDLVQRYEDIVVDTYLGKGTTEEYFIEQANLLHMRRQINDAWYFGYSWFSGYDDSLQGVEVTSAED